MQMREANDRKASERRLDLYADDRVVAPGHADIGEKRRALRQNAFVRRLHVRVRADESGNLRTRIDGVDVAALDLHLVWKRFPRKVGDVGSMDTLVVGRCEALWIS